MAEFSVNIEKMEEVAADAEQVSRILGEKLSELEAARSQINACMSGTGGKSVRRINALEDKVKKLNREISMLSQKLLEISGIYQAYEKRILGLKGSGDAESRDSAGRSGEPSILDRIRNVLSKIKKAGLNPNVAYSADPVNLSTGNYVYENNYFSYDSPVFNNLRLFYNAQEKHVGMAGKGWITSFERRLVIEDEHAWVLGEDGARTEFYISGRGSFISVFASNDILEKDNDGYLFTDENMNCFRFDHSGKLQEVFTEDGTYRICYEYHDGALSQVKDSYGVSFSMSYTEDGKVSDITDSAGRSVSFSYDGDLLVGVTDPEGNTTGYAYDSFDRLEKVISPDSECALFNRFDEQGRTVSQIFADGGEVRYQYDDGSRQVIMTQQNGSNIVYEHDERYRHVKTIFPDGEEYFSYDDNNLLTSETDARGNTKKYEYDAIGNIAKIINPLGDVLEILRNDRGQVNRLLLNDITLQSSDYDEAGHQVSSMDAAGNLVKFEYDVYGNISACIRQDGSRAEYLYNDRGDLIRVFTPEQGETLYEYDDCRRVSASTDALGNRTEYEYDKNDRIVRVVNALGEEQTYEYDCRGNMIRMTGFGGGVTTIRYNSLNKPEAYIDEDGNCTEYSYDRMWNVISRKTQDGAVTCYEYDGRGRMVSITDPEGNTQKAAYDPCGNLVRRTTEDGADYQMGYDELNRLISITDPLGIVRKAGYDALGNVVVVDYGDGIKESAEYDLAGNLTSYTDRTGYTRTFEYTELGNVREIADEKGWIRRYEYFPGGLLKKEYGSDGSWKQYEYDKTGKVVSISDECGGGWNFSYDVLGRVIEAEHIDDRTERYEYDPAGNVSAVIDAEGNRTLYKYSGSGDLLHMQDAEGSETGFLYDSCHRLIRILQPESGKLNAGDIKELSQSGDDLRVTSFVRDKRGNVISRVNAEGAEAKFAYDACGRLSSVTDEDGNMIDIRYYADGMREALLLPDAKSIMYQYNALKQLVRIQDWLGEICLDRDEEGRLLHVSDQKNRNINYQWEADQLKQICYPDGKIAEYCYDEKRRLSDCLYGDISYHMEYGEGTRLKKRSCDHGPAVEFTYNRAGYPMNIIHSDHGTAVESLAFRYDACGRLAESVRRQEEGNAQRIKYDYTPLGMLASVQKDGIQTAAYTYDIFGNRTYSREGDFESSYTYNRLDQLLSMTCEGGTRTFSYDRRGNLRDVHLDGKKVLELTFDAMNHLTGAVSPNGSAKYAYNGLYRRTSAQFLLNGTSFNEEYVYDYTRASENLLMKEGGAKAENLLWCDDLLLIDRENRPEFVCADERRSLIASIDGRNGLPHLQHMQYEAFGSGHAKGAAGENVFDTGFTGYRNDPVTGLLHANQREYDPRAGRFISMDSVAAVIMVPCAINGYLYCLNDPVNAYDPTGLIAAWLAGGIVGAVVRTGTKFAGDVVKTVTTGKPSFSSWQSYAGAAAGGFTEGSVFVGATIAAGGNVKAGMSAAGAAGNAVDTLVTNGLSMATHAKGFENYSMKDLCRNTIVSTAEGAVEGFAFGAAAKHIKINGITKGRNSFQAVFKSGITKGIRYGFNMSWKTVAKGAFAYGVIGTIDKIYGGLKDKIKDKLKETGKDFVKNLFQRVVSGGRNISTAACAATGSRPQALRLP